MNASTLRLAPPLTVSDAEIDEACAQWNGRYVPLEVAEGAPRGHPNCRRDIIPDTSALGRRRDAAEPAETKDDGLLTLRLPAPVVHVAAPVIPAPVVNVPATTVNVPAPVVNVERPVVNVAPPDLGPVVAAVASLRSDMADLRAEVRKPRTKTLVRDDLGRVVGSKGE